MLGEAAKDEDVFLTRYAKGKRGKALNKRFVLQKEAADVMKAAVTERSLQEKGHRLLNMKSGGFL